MKVRNYMIAGIMSVFIGSLSLWNLLGEQQNYSESERRVLAKFPETEIQNVLSGKFSEQFDAYAVDHFPMRDLWRSLKAYVNTGILGQKDNNGIYTAQGHISKIEYPMNEEMINYAVQIFEKVKEQYFSDNQIYLVVVPDKNRYLADENGYLALDYDTFSAYVSEHMPYAEYIEIADLLEADDYYKTDTHWRQEKIIDVAARIAAEMGVEFTTDGTEIILEKPFYGVYAGQSALFCEPDTIVCVTNEAIEYAELDGAKAVYDMKKAEGKDPYELFLSGNQSVITIRNQQNQSGRRLIVFRDSFGSGIAPLWIESYSEMVLVDLRYILPGMLGEYIDFDQADVLFLYSTLLLNQSLSLKK